MLDVVQQMGETLRRRFAACSWDYARFPALATEALAAVELPSLTLADLPRLLIDLRRPAPRLDDHFSDFPLVLYQHSHFRIELLSWLQASTSVHQHAFSGAFRVWEGSSLHSRYRFSGQQSVGVGVYRGETEYLGSEWLDRGDIRTIHAGAGLTHAVFHLQRPTFSLVARTHSEPWHAPQLTLLRPGYAYDPVALRSCLQPYEQMVRLYQHLGAAAIAEYLLPQLQRLPLAVILVHGGWWLNMAQREGCAGQLLQAVSQQWGAALAAQLEAAALHHAIGQQGHYLRENLDDPLLRLFIAVLMQAPQRDVIEQLLACKLSQQVHSAIPELAAQLLASGHLSVTLRGGPVSQLFALAMGLADEAEFIRQYQAQGLAAEAGLDHQAAIDLYRRLRGIPLFTLLHQ